MLTSETLMHIIPQTTTEKLLWERQANIVLNKEVKELKRTFYGLKKEKKEIEEELKRTKEALKVYIEKSSKY